MTKRMHDNLQEKYKSSVTVCSYNVTYAFQSESTLYICLNVKELLAQNRRDIGTLSDCNGTRTRNHLVRKRTLNHLAKLGSSPVAVTKSSVFQILKLCKAFSNFDFNSTIMKTIHWVMQLFQNKVKKRISLIDSLPYLFSI